MENKPLQAAKAKLEAYHGITIPDMIMEEAIAAYEAAKGDGWRPISEAPKDGSLIDVYVSELQERYPDSYYCKEAKAFCFDMEGTGKRLIFSATPPTHYQPLPLPPESERGA